MGSYGVEVGSLGAAGVVRVRGGAFVRVVADPGGLQPCLDIGTRAVVSGSVLHGGDLGLAVYSKPTNVFLSAPLLLEPLLSWRWRGLGESVKRGLWLSFATLLFFGLNYRPEARVRKARRTRSSPSSGGVDVRIGWNLESDSSGGRGRGKATVKTKVPARSAELAGVVPEEPRLFLGGKVWRSAALLSCVRDRGPRVPGDRRPTASGWLCFLSLVTSFRVLHLAHPGQLVRGRRDGGEPVLPEPSSPGSLRVAAVGKAGVGAPGGIAGLGLLGPVLASPLRHSLHPGTPCHDRGLPQAGHAQRPLCLH